MKKLIMMLFVVALVAVACKESKFKGFDQTESGLYYKFHQKGDDTVRAHTGDIIVAYIYYRTLNDSMFNNSPHRTPLEIQMNKSVYKGDIWEGLAMMGKGDSATFVTSVDSFFNILSHQPIPNFLDSGSFFYMDVKVVDILTKEQQAKKQMEEMARMKKVEEASIADYIKKNAITAAPDSNGIYAIYDKKGKDKVVAAGNHVKVNIKLTILGQSQPIYDTWAETAGKGTDFVVGTGYFGMGLENYLNKGHQGDKFTLIIPSEMAFGARGSQGIVPPYSPIEYTCEILDTYTEKEFQAKKTAEELKAKNEEKKAISKYIKDNKISAKPDENGIYKIVMKEGNGKQVANGNKVSVHYNGYLLSGKKFDSSYDRKTPFDFVIGQGSVIRGWDLAVLNMKVGEKSKFIIPSVLAYGPSGSGAEIAPFTTLVFEIEVLGINNK